MRAFNGRPHHDNLASLRESQRTTGGKTCLCLTSTRVTDRGTDGLRDGGSAALLQFMANNEEKLLNCCFCLVFCLTLGLSNFQELASDTVRKLTLTDGTSALHLQRMLIGPFILQLARKNLDWRFSRWVFR